MERWLQQSLIYHGRIFSVTAGQAQLDNGRLVPREMVVHEGGVAIVPLLGDEILLVKQFRIVIGKHLLELNGLGPCANPTRLEGVQNFLGFLLSQTRSSEREELIAHGYTTVNG